MVLMYTPPGELGSTAPDFSLPGVDGRLHRLVDYRDAPVLVVMFLCNHCPYVQAVEQRLINLANDVVGQGVALVGINSNDANLYPEDGFDHMRRRAREKKYSFDYLVDESQLVARAYRAVCTPDFFVYNRQRELCYRGRLDDSPQDAARVGRQELREAILALLADQPVASLQHPAMGCSIKWRG